MSFELLHRLFTFLCLLLSLLISYGVTAQEEIILWDRNYVREEFRDIVNLAMQLTEDEYGSYIIKSSRPMEQGTVFAALARDTGVNMAIAATSKEREKTVQTIYIPVDKGLLGFRICLVNQDDRHIFSKINTLADINKARFSIGVGTHWPDRTVIEDNGLRTSHSEVYENLFDMLYKQRFTCFLRSVNEIDSEIMAHPHMNFTDEQHIALLYPSADFMFVAKSSKRLKERLEKGIKIAIENGDFDAHFDKHYMTVLQKYNFFNRKLLFLKNKNISEQALSAINIYGLASFTNDY